MDEFWSSTSKKSGLDSVELESTDALQLVPIDDELVNKVANSISVENDVNDNPPDAVLDIFNRDYLKKLSTSNGCADDFLSKFKDANAGQSNGPSQEESVESFLNKIKSSDDDYFNTHRYGTRLSGVKKLKDTTNIRKSTESNADTSKPASKRLIHNKINQTVVDLTEEDDDLLKIFDRDLIRDHERYSPVLLQDHIILQDADLDDLINVDEIDEVKELAERRETEQPCDDLEPEKRDHDLASSSSEEIDVMTPFNKQLLDQPADEDSVSLPEVDRVNLDQLRGDLNISGDLEDLEDSNSRESFKKLTVDSSSLRDVYKVEKLLQKRIRRNGRSEYLVKYENLDDDQTHWESEKTLDPKIVEEFNRKYGDKLLLKDLDKKTYSKYFDKRIDETGRTAKDALQKPTANVDLKQLIEKSISHPLCNFYNNVKPERIVGVYEHECRFYFLVKWEKLTKADLFECAKFQEKWPDVALEFYTSKIMFNDLEERRESAELSAKRRVDLLKQPQ